MSNTFATSNFKKYYSMAEEPKEIYEITKPIDQLIQAYCTFKNKNKDIGKRLFHNLTKEMMSDEQTIKELIGEISAAAQRLWTSTCG